LWWWRIAFERVRPTVTLRSALLLGPRLVRIHDEAVVVYVYIAGCVNIENRLVGRCFKRGN
jgi:hypothetical protein